jgi:hypothetical protein
MSIFICRNKIKTLAVRGAARSTIFMPDRIIQTKKEREYNFKLIGGMNLH